MTYPIFDGWTLLDESVQQAVTAQRDAGMDYQPPTDVEALAATRFALPDLGTTDPVERTDITVTHGDVRVPARLHRPVGVDGPLPCIVSIHGGGYVAGSQALDDYLFEQWAPALGVLGLSVEYRLAPEFPYPAALDDCDAVTRWLLDHIDELGVDASRIGLMGPSAGAGLATALALRLRDENRSPFSFMLLDAPMLDDRQLTRSSQLDGLVVWSRESNTFGWKSYLGDLYGAEDVPVYAAPGRATDVNGLPPMLLTAGGADGFRDENIAFAALLAEQGVAVDFNLYAGTPHGNGMFSEWSATFRQSRDRLDWAARKLGRTVHLTDDELSSTAMKAVLERAFAHMFSAGAG